MKLYSVLATSALSMTTLLMLSATSATSESLKTTLLFRTQPGSVTLPAGSFKTLATVDVSSYSQIRVVADQRVGSSGKAKILLTVTEGNELVANIDTINLNPPSELSKVYDIPGKKITIQGQGVGGTANIDLLIYGR